jgi:PAS domain S-box-containing protein
MTTEPAHSDDEFGLALVDAAPDGIVLVDETGRILFVNRQMHELFGYERDTLVGRSVDELVPNQFRSAHRAHRNRYRAEPRIRAMGAHDVLRGLRKDGTEFPVEISLSPLPSATHLEVIAVVRDVSDRVEAEAQVRATREILDAAQDGMFILDAATLHFTYVNSGAVEQVGYPRGELLQMSMLQIAPQLTQERLHAMLAPLEHGAIASTTYTTMHRHRDGHDRPVEILLQAVHGTTGRPDAYVVIARDISERLAAVEQRRRVERALGQVEDRERIARDLHDLTIQRLFAAGMSLQAAQMLSNQDDVKVRISSVVDDLDDTIRELRSVIFGLQSDLHASGLRAEILRLVSELSPALGFEPRLRLDGLIDTLDESIAVEMLATLREAISNIARHARASSAGIVVDCRDRVVVQVVDDGVGIPPDAVVGNGIANMTERALRLGGTCHVTRRAGGGTVLEWQVPNPQ